jgi:hypothetical protein
MGWFGTYETSTLRLEVSKVASAATRWCPGGNAPLPGKSLYRFSSGHGGLECEACHGSTHAEFPAAHRNDNIQSIEHQGHIGMFVECASCHGSQPNTVNGGPHGIHPVGQAWVQAHGDAVGEGDNASQCTACHGADYRGTVLSRVKGNRILSGEFGSKQVWRGFQIGCYTFHRGPGNSDPNPNRPAVVTDATVTTPADMPVSITLQAHDPDGNPLTLRIVSQPARGGRCDQRRRREQRVPQLRPLRADPVAARRGPLVPLGDRAHRAGTGPPASARRARSATATSIGRRVRLAARSAAPLIESDEGAILAI